MGGVDVMDKLIDSIKHHEGCKLIPYQDTAGKMTIGFGQAFIASIAVNLFCRPWGKTGDYWTVYWDLTRQVKERFDAEGISIPFPQRDVHTHSESVPT